MNDKKEELLLKEILNRETPTVFDFEKGSFDKQINFINDPAKLKAAFCTRRASKSFTGGLYLVKKAIERPGVSCLFIALTRASAKAILWKDVLKVINKTYDLGIKFNESALTATLSNGSIIYLVGADSTEEEKQKLLGQKYALVIIDEAASYTIDLRELVYSILKPAVADYRGEICLMGTPGNFTKGLFFDVTNKKEPGWSLHEWTTMDNPYMKEAWEQEIKELIANNPNIVETPWFKQMYLGQWVIDTDKLVYKYEVNRNSFLTLPVLKNGNYRYVLGVDLGYDDASAFSLGCYSDYDPTLYIVKCFKASKMDITDVANKIKEFQSEYEIGYTVVDGANKQAVEEIKKRHQIPLRAADKTGKEDFIEIMNSELIQGKIKVHLHNGFDLVDEWLGLVWKTKGGAVEIPKKEHPGCPNHVADSALYLWRYAYQYLWTKLEEPPKINTESWYKKQTEMMEKAAEDEFARQKQQQDEEAAALGIFENGIDDDFV